MEWIMGKSKYPKEIVNFLNSIFEIYEIRGRVGSINSISFLVHSNEQNHNIPHIHAKYNEYEISIEISDDAKILVGKLPNRKQKEAQDWVIKNKCRLLDEWRNSVISANSTLIASNLDRKY